MNSVAQKNHRLARPPFALRAPAYSLNRVDRFSKPLTTAGVAGALAVLGFLTGCASIDKPYQPPAPPKMGPVTPVAPRPVLTVAEATTVAGQHLTADEFDALVATLAPFNPADRTSILRSLLTPVAQKDPWRAGRIALALPEGELQNLAMEVAVPAMIARDADATIRWVLAAPTATDRFVAGRAVVELWTKRDPKAAMDHLLAQPESRERNYLLGLLAAGWARRDANAALSAVRAIPHGEARTQTITSVAYQLSFTQPARAVEVAELVPEGPERLRLYSAIGQTWVALDAQAAWKWANALPVGEARLAAANGIQTGLGAAGYRSLAYDTAPYGGGLVAMGGGGASLAGAPPPPVPRDGYGLPLGLGREEAVRRRFEEMLQQSPRRAADWLATLPSPDRNDEILRRLSREWYLIDPQAAKSWLDVNVPSVAQRQVLLEEARR